MGKIKPKMHYADVKNSKRLRRVLFVLVVELDWISTMELSNKCNVCAVSSIISELRRNGYEIECKRFGDKWKYRMKNRVRLNLI
jgi:hypothetical protein